MKKARSWVRTGRVYIVPTGFGLIFIIGAMTMILVGATYQNNLVNLLAFFMLSLVFIAMVQTNNNLKSIQLEQLIAENGFAGSDFLLTTVISNPTRDVRYNLEPKLRRQKPRSVYENVQPLLASGTLKLRASYSCPKRGVYQFHDIRLDTVFPLGLFRAWMWLPAEAKHYVYPSPEGSRPLPTRTIAEASSGTSLVRGGDDFYGHRRYQTGDYVGHIDWKARARGRPLMVKEFNDGSPAPVRLDWSTLEDLDTEERLSQLAKWVDDATKAKLYFSLKLPHVELAPASGNSHAQRCLEALASYGFESKDTRATG